MAHHVRQVNYAVTPAQEEQPETAKIRVDSMHGVIYELNWAMHTPG